MARLNLPVHAVRPQVGIVHGSQVIRILVLVLLHVRLVDPLQAVHEHVIHRRAQVPHQTHEEEGDLQDGMLDEVDAIDDLFVPRRAAEVSEETGEADQAADAERGNGYQ